MTISEKLTNYKLKLKNIKTEEQGKEALMILSEIEFKHGISKTLDVKRNKIINRIIQIRQNKRQ